MYTLKSCCLENTVINVPINDESFKKRSILDDSILFISNSNNLNIQISNSSCSGFGINTLS